jgi:hypothetical protein
MELLALAAAALQLHVGHFVPHLLTQSLSFRLPAAYGAPELQNIGFCETKSNTSHIKMKKLQRYYCTRTVG